MDITLRVPDSVGNKIQALSIITGKDGTQIASLFADKLEDFLNQHIIAACGGNIVPTQSVGAHVPGQQLRDVSGNTVGIGEPEDRFDEDGNDTLPPQVIDEAAEIQKNLLEMQSASRAAPKKGADTLVDDIQEEMEAGTLESVDEDYELDAEEPKPRRTGPLEGDGMGLSAGAGQLPENYGVDNLMSDGGQADFFMSALEGRQVRTGIGGREIKSQSRARVSRVKG